MVTSTSSSTTSVSAGLVTLTTGAFGSFTVTFTVTSLVLPNPSVARTTTTYGVNEATEPAWKLSAPVVSFTANNAAFVPPFRLQLTSLSASNVTSEEHTSAL